MGDAVRRAKAVWDGDLMSGSGVVSAISSGAFSEMLVSWASRIEDSGGRTSPEELLASAHASCFCMALSAGLGRAGTPPNKLEASAEVTFQQIEGGWRVSSSSLTVKGDVPGIDADTFAAAAEAAKEGCPISGALRGNVDFNVTAELVS